MDFEHSSEMSNTNSPRAEDRSLRDRIADLLRPSSPSARTAGLNDSGLEGRPSDFGNSSNANLPPEFPDDRTLLLDNYERRESVCGQRECNHGTFSPRPEDQDAGPPASAFFGFRTPRILSSGIQTPATENISITNRLATEAGVKHRRTMCVKSLEFGLKQIIDAE
jgi:hypothetical protein